MSFWNEQKKNVLNQRNKKKTIQNYYSQFPCCQRKIENE